MENLNQSLINTFNMLKEKGLFCDYKDYADWLEKKGKPRVKFQDTLQLQEKEDYEDIFGT